MSVKKDGASSNKKDLPDAKTLATAEIEETEKDVDIFEFADRMELEILYRPVIAAIHDSELHTVGKQANIAVLFRLL